MLSTAGKISNWPGFFLLGLALASCQKPIEPAVEAPPELDASTEVQAIQRDAQRHGEQVMQLARAQAAQELGNAAKALAPWESSDSAALDGGQSTANAGEAGVAGKLEKVEPDTLIIRDGSGFEFWLKASDNTQITYNGKRARLTDCPTHRFQAGSGCARVFCLAGEPEGGNRGRGAGRRTAAGWRTAIRRGNLRDQTPDSLRVPESCSTIGRCPWSATRCK